MGRRITVFALLVIITLTLGYLAGCASSGQPHMNAAADELRAARQELEAAVADKGGHRERAIAFVDDALTEVRAGIDFARTH